MRANCLVGLSVLALSIPGARAAEPPYPDEVTSFAARTMKAEAERRLEKAAADFNALVANPAAVAERMEDAGLRPEDVAAWKARYGELASGTARAELAEGKITLAADGHRIEIDAADYLASRMQVDGKPFAWKPKLSFAANLEAYDRLFRGARSALDFLVPAAHAAKPKQHLSIQAAGLVLHFLVEAGRSRATLLERLNDEIRDELRVCATSGASEYRERSLDRAVQAALSVTDIVAGRTRHLRSCADVREFATPPPVLNEGLPFPVPSDLCDRLNALAGCLRAKYPPSARSRDQKKRLREEGGSEWREQSLPDGAGKAR
jgi:hypothetical protein